METNGVKTKPSCYTQSGVDIDAGDRVKKRISKSIKQTYTKCVLHKEGAFGAMFSMSNNSMEKPVLVSSMDGVGTKVKLAVSTGKHYGIGCDLVNHSINDILTCGAKPLFFLDYFACAKQNDDVVLQLIDGMSTACKAAGMALIGGETAQMSDVYAPEEYDLAACIVGVVDEDDIINGSKITPGNSIIGIPSSGLHTNGYTLARKVLIEECGYALDKVAPRLRRTLGEDLLEPHRSYLDEVTKIREITEVRGIAHITGGGFEGNVSRILPDHCKSKIDTNVWRPQPIFSLIQKSGNIPKEEMYRVFNMGIGLVIVIKQSDKNLVCNQIEGSICIGEIVKGSGVELEF